MVDGLHVIRAAGHGGARKAHEEAVEEAVGNVAAVEAVVDIVLKDGAPHAALGRLPPHFVQHHHHGPQRLPPQQRGLFTARAHHDIKHDVQHGGQVLHHHAVVGVLEPVKRLHEVVVVLGIVRRVHRAQGLVLCEDGRVEAEADLQQRLEPRLLAPQVPALRLGGGHHHAVVVAVVVTHKLVRVQQRHHCKPHALRNALLVLLLLR
mmetsp:Transcript_32052/g.80440  ORF Transcript_32052/g.80440 Transcript_32052/m.80440 type:complete len:206 (+) Transcript_32052:3108-3725(+)